MNHDMHHTKPLRRLKRNALINHKKKDNFTKCDFLGRNGEICGRICQKGYNQCPIHYNIKFPLCLQNIDIKKNQNQSEEHIENTASKKRFIEQDNSSNTSHTQLKYVDQSCKQNDEMETMMEKLKELQIKEKRFLFVEDEYNKKIMNKVYSKFYYTKKQDLKFTKIVADNYKKTIYDEVIKKSKSKSQADDSSAFSSSDSDNEISKKHLKVPYKFFHNFTNLVFDSLPEHKKEKWIKKVEKEELVFS